MGRTSTAKEKLLEVAFRLIWKNNYGSVSVDDICLQAGVKKGSFYHFFESKVALAVAAYEENWRLKLPEYERIFSPKTPGLRRLSNFCRFLYDIQKQKAAEYGYVCGCPYGSMGGEIATQDDRLRAKCEQMMTRTLKFLETALIDADRDGSIHCPDPAGAANLIYSLALGTMLRAKVHNKLEIMCGLEPAVMTLAGQRQTVPAPAPDLVSA